MKCTSELLLGPDWMANMELCDIINDNVDTNGKDALRALKRRLNRGFNNKNSKVMILALTALDGCVKNCGTGLHQLMASTGIMDDMKKIWASMEVNSCKMRSNPLSEGNSSTGIAGGTSSTDVDYEVMEKVLMLVAEWGEALGGSFMKVYDEMRGMGAPFPERSENVAPPIATPPQRHETEADRMARANEEAIQQAIAEVESENRVLQAAMHGDGAGGGGAARETGTRTRAASGSNNPLSNGGGAQFAPDATWSGIDGASSFQHHLNEAEQMQLNAAGGGGGDNGGTTSVVVDGVPMTLLGPQCPSEQQRQVAETASVIGSWDEEKSVAAISVQLLSEMLAGIEATDTSALNDELIVDLVGKCRQMQPRIVQLIETSEDENVLAEALQMNDDIAKALSDFDARKAGSTGEGVMSPPPPLLDPQQQQRGYVPPQVVHSEPARTPPAATAVTPVSNFEVVPQLVSDVASPPAPIFDLLTGDPLPPESGAAVQSGEMMNNPFLMYAPPADTTAAEAPGTSTPPPASLTEPEDDTELQQLDAHVNATPPVNKAEKTVTPLPSSSSSPSPLQATEPIASAAVGNGKKVEGATSMLTAADAAQEMESMPPAAKSSSGVSDPFKSASRQRRDDSRAQSQSLLGGGGGDANDAADDFWRSQLSLNGNGNMNSAFAL